LVGGEFFDGTAGLFIADHPPRAAWLDNYGDEFPDFLRGFQPAATLAYLPDVARLEWAVSRAIHAVDKEPLDLKRLGSLAPDQQARVSFVPHPSVTLLRADFPADTIWRAVLDGDDAALAAIDVNSGPAHLLVERRASGVEVSQLDETAWRFVAALCDGRHLERSLDEASDVQSYVLLAEQLTAGRFVDFNVAPIGDGGTRGATPNEASKDQMPNTAMQSARREL
jgi:Putative DNA-binding domain